MLTNSHSSKEQYDRGVNTFSPEGRIYQIEYAIKAIKVSLNTNEVAPKYQIWLTTSNLIIQFGSTAIGVKTAEGVVLGIEKKLPSSKLMEISNKSEKLVEIDRHCVCAMSGIVGDARILIDHARVEA